VCTFRAVLTLYTFLRYALAKITERSTQLPSLRLQTSTAATSNKRVNVLAAGLLLAQVWTERSKKGRSGMRMTKQEQPPSSTWAKTAKRTMRLPSLRLQTTTSAISNNMVNILHAGEIRQGMTQRNKYLTSTAS
jgi:hypothetical protein